MEETSTNVSGQIQSNGFHPCGTQNRISSSKSSETLFSETGPPPLNLLLHLPQLVIQIGDLPFVIVLRADFGYFRLRQVQLRLTQLYDGT
jgi:hypothetical protein